MFDTVRRVEPEQLRPALHGLEDHHARLGVALFRRPGHAADHGVDLSELELHLVLGEGASLVGDGAQLFLHAVVSGLLGDAELLTDLGEGKPLAPQRERGLAPHLGDGLRDAARRHYAASANAGQSQRSKPCGSTT